MATSPNYGWLEPDNTDLVKNGALAIRTLGNAIDTTMATMVPKSIVDAKGDLIAGTAADTTARLAVGNNGETLVADSSTSTGLRYQAPVQANPVINSAFQIWQRGTTITNAGSSQYNADRWQGFRGGAVAGLTISRQVTGDTTNLPNIQYCARVQRDSGNTSTAYATITQPFETINTIPYVGKTVTVSYYARRGANFSATSNALLLSVYTGTGTDQTWISGYTGFAVAIQTAATLTTTWQRFTATVTLASTITEMSLGFSWDPTGTAGANDYFEITGVQLEVGSVATPFKTYAGTIQGETSACQRYYYSVASGNTQPLGSAWTDATTQGQIMIPFPVTMRTSPSLVQTTGTNYYNINTANSGKLFNSFVGLNIVSTTMATIYSTISGGTAGQGGYAYTANASASIALSAEL